jgi:hypothetical protein
MRISPKFITPSRGFEFGRPALPAAPRAFPAGRAIRAPHNHDRDRQDASRGSAGRSPEEGGGRAGSRPPTLARLGAPSFPPTAVSRRWIPWIADSLRRSHRSRLRALWPVRGQPSLSAGSRSFASSYILRLPSSTASSHSSFGTRSLAVPRSAGKGQTFDGRPRKVLQNGQIFGRISSC